MPVSNPIVELTGVFFTFSKGIPFESVGTHGGGVAKTSLLLEETRFLLNLSKTGTLG